MDDSFCWIFDEEEFVDTNFNWPASPDDMFRMFNGGFDEDRMFLPLDMETLVEVKGGQEEEGNKKPKEVRLKSKRGKSGGSDVETEEDGDEGKKRMSHVAVERNRRKQINEHLSILRSIMPCFYVKRGDQASTIGGVVEYISELQQVQQSLEAKKQRKAYSKVLSPRPSVVAPPLLSPRKPPLCPRISLPISPKTPQPPTSPYKPLPSLLVPIPQSPTSSSSASVSSSIDSMNILGSHDLHPVAANSKSEVADVEVRFSGVNLVLRTVSPRIPGQVIKIIAALEDLSFEVLHVRICPVDKSTVVNSFTIKIGIECQLSAEELALLINQTFL